MGCVRLDEAYPLYKPLNEATRARVAQGIV